MRGKSLYYRGLLITRSNKSWLASVQGVGLALTAASEKDLYTEIDRYMDQGPVFAFIDNGFKFYPNEDDSEGQKEPSSCTK